MNLEKIKDSGKQKNNEINETKKIWRQKMRHRNFKKCLNDL